MPGIFQTFTSRPIHFAKTSVQFAASGATTEIVGTGKRVAIWGVYASAAQATSVTISVENQAATVLWAGRVTATVGANLSMSFDNPILSLDGLQVVTTGATNGCDVTVLYEEF